MTDTFTKTLPKRIPTKHPGVYYKEIQQTKIDEKGSKRTRVIDKVYVIRYRDKGKEHLITLGKYSEGIREAYCKTKRNEFLTLAKNGELPPQLEQRMKKDITTLDQLAKIYFDDKKRANKTNIKQEQKYNLHLKYQLGTKDITQLTKNDVKRLQEQLTNKGKAPKTVNGIIQLLTAIINYNIKEKDLKLTNPTIGVKPLKVNDRRERFLSITEVRLLLENVAADELLEPFTKLALSTGARLEAILNIQKKDFDLEHNQVTLKDLKSDSTYIGFYDDSLKTYIANKLPKLNPNDYFIGGREQPFPNRTIQRQLKPILDELFNVGLDRKDTKNRVVIHTLRHTFASQLAIKGVPIFTIQKLMNHADITMTMRYAKLAPDSGRDVVKGLYDV